MLQDETNTYVYGLDLISATDGSGDQTYFLYDGLGSVTDLTDDEGDAVDDYTYDVFGATRSQSGSSDNYWLFTGEQQDADSENSELYYLRARYYDPEIGRFLSQDPLPLGNLYTYVGNNPVNRVDPSGLMHIADVGGVRPKEGGGFDFDRLCPNRDPNRIYIIDDGVCYDITPDCDPLLCGGGESGLGFLNKVGEGIIDSFKPDDAILQNGQSSDCGFQFGSWCALDTDLDPLVRLVAGNPECAGAVGMLGIVTAAAAADPPTAPGLFPAWSTLLEAAITSCMS